MKVNSHSSGWITWFVHNPVAANLLMVCILLLGFFSLGQMRTEGFPASEVRTIVISVSYPGGSPEEIERGAIIKIENALKGISGIEKTTATIQSSHASVTVKAKQGFEISRLYSDIKRQVDTITTFPLQLEKVTVKRQQEQFPILDIQVSGDLSERTLTHTAERIRQQLLSLKNVSKIVFQGKRSEEINILVKPEMLDAYQLNINDVASAIRQASLDLSAGEIKTTVGSLAIISNNRGLSGKDFNDIVLRKNDQGALIRISDVASVIDGFSEKKILSRFNQRPSVNLQVQLVGKDSIIPIAEAVEQKLAEIQSRSWIPQGLEVQVWANQADNIRRSLSLISTNALMGMLLVLIILSIFLHHKVAFWVAIGIPVSFAGAFIVMGPQYLDYSINMITTLAFIIVLGVVVDDAIVIGENIYSHAQNDKAENNKDLVNSTIRGAKEVAVPATFGVLTTVAAFYPLTTIKGEFGGPFSIIGGVTIACLLFSLIESKFILPAHLAAINIRPENHNHYWQRLRLVIDSYLERFIREKYHPAISLAIKHRYQSILVFIAIFVFSIGLATSGTVKVVFFGDNPGNTIHARVTLNPGYSAEDTRRTAMQLEHSLQSASRQLQKKYHLSEPQLHFNYTLSSNDFSAELTAQIPASDQRPYRTQEYLDQWQQLNGDIAGARELSFYIDWESSQDLRLELSASNLKQLEQAQHSLEKQLSKIDGVYDLRSTADNQRIEYEVKLTQHAYLLGLDNQYVVDQLRNAIYGLEAQKIQRQENEISVRIRYPLSRRNSVFDLNQLRIRIKEDRYVYLNEIAELVPVAKATKVERIDGHRTIAVTAQLNTNVITSPELMSRLQQQIFPDLTKQYQDVNLTFAGENKAEQDATHKLAAGFLLSLVLIYGLIAIPLRSYSKPLIIMMAIPFGIVGAIFGHLIIGIPISLLSFFGILALSGVVVNDSLVLVSRYNQLRTTGLNISDALIQAGCSRFRAILLTSLTTFCGLFPLIMETSEEAQLLIPMAVSLAFGIIFATLITLFIIPVLISIAGDIKQYIFFKSEPDHS